jgi:hypothetical protein
MNVTDIRRLTETPGEHVGGLIWWALEGARIRRPDLETVFSQAGISLGFLPEPPTAEKALKSAIGEALIGVSDHLIRLGKDDEDVQACCKRARGRITIGVSTNPSCTGVHSCAIGGASPWRPKQRQYDWKCWIWEEQPWMSRAGTFALDASGFVLLPP